MKNSGLLLSFDYVKENREELLPKISEGCLELEKILNFCVDKDMPTIACCAGHKIGDKPYITMYYDKNTRKKINGFLNKLESVLGIKVMFSTIGFTNNPFSVTIYTKMSNRDKVFSIINDCLSANIEDEYLSEELNIVLNIAIMLDYRQQCANVSLYNKRFQQMYMVGVYGKQWEGNILDEYKDKKKIQKDPYKMTYYLYKDIKKLKLVSDEYEILHKNGFSYHGFHILANVSPNEKVDRIIEYNQLIERENGSIRRNCL